MYNHSKKFAGIFLICFVFLSFGNSAYAAKQLSSVEQIMMDLGFRSDDLQKVLEGEILAEELTEKSKRGIALKMVMFLPVSLDKVVSEISKGRIFDINRQVLAYHILESDDDTHLFSGVVFDPKEMKEIDKLLKVKPGSVFNFSSSEIAAFQDAAKKLKGDKNAHARQKAVESTYREILKLRYDAFLSGGLKNTADYLRGKGKSSNPGYHLTKAVNHETVLQKEAPEFYKALKNFPRDGSSDIQNQFLWIKLEAQNRPNFVLAHRMFRFDDKNALMTERQFFVSHSYNALQIIAAAFQVEEGTLLLYANRTFTDQVGGFGGDFKRGVGRQMMKKELVKFFEDFRKDVQN